MRSNSWTEEELEILRRAITEGPIVTRKLKKALPNRTENAINTRVFLLRKEMQKTAPTPIEVTVKGFTYTTTDAEKAAKFISLVQGITS